jgi:hypothetical protein
MDRARSYSRAWYTASGYRIRLRCSSESSLSKTRQSWSSCPAFRSIKNDSRVSGIHETDSVIIACPRGRISRKAMETTLSEWITFFLLVRLTRRQGNMDEISGRSAVIAVNAAYKAIAVKRNITETDIKTEEETRPTLGRLLVASAKNHKGRLVKHVAHAGSEEEE